MSEVIISPNTIDAYPVKVLFDMWGQRCETVCASERDALRWLSTCASKGWLLAIEVIGVDGVLLYEGDELQKMVDR